MFWIHVPDGTIISPSENAGNALILGIISVRVSAVVGGNVLTSQRLCDVIFLAFEACAASQGRHYTYPDLNAFEFRMHEQRDFRK